MGLPYWYILSLGPTPSPMSPVKVSTLAGKPCDPRHEEKNQDQGHRDVQKPLRSEPLLTLCLHIPTMQRAAHPAVNHPEGDDLRGRSRLRDESLEPDEAPAAKKHRP